MRAIAAASPQSRTVKQQVSPPNAALPKARRKRSTTAPKPDAYVPPKRAPSPSSTGLDGKRAPVGDSDSPKRRKRAAAANPAAGTRRSVLRRQLPVPVRVSTPTTRLDPTAVAAAAASILTHVLKDTLHVTCQQGLKEGTKTAVSHLFQLLLGATGMTVFELASALRHYVNQVKAVAGIPPKDEAGPPSR